MKKLHTKRLRLEPLEPRHAEAMFDGLQDEAAYEFIADTPPQSLELLRQRFVALAQRRSSNGNETWLNWVIWAIPEERFVGYVQATLPVKDDYAIVAYFLFPNAWGRGYAREAVLSMAEHLIKEYNVLELRAYVDPRNYRSTKLLIDLGFISHASSRNGGLINETRTDDVEFRKPSFEN